MCRCAFFFFFCMFISWGLPQELVGPPLKSHHCWKRSLVEAAASQENFKSRLKKNKHSSMGFLGLSKRGLLKPSRSWLLNPASRNRVRERLTLQEPGCCNHHRINKPPGMHLRKLTHAQKKKTTFSNQNSFWPPYSNVKTVLWMQSAPVGPPFPNCISYVLVALGSLTCRASSHSWWEILSGFFRSWWLENSMKLGWDFQPPCIQLNLPLSGALLPRWGPFRSQVFLGGENILP